MSDFIYSLEMDVRDYECDLQGVVNNSVYQNYLEHTRHQYLLSAGYDFAKLHHEDGIDAMVSRIEIDYKYPLRSGDKFISKLFLEPNGKFRLNFRQSIFLLPDEKPIVNAVVVGVCVQNGRPIPVDRVFKL